MKPIQNEPGWAGAFTRNQVPGALANGTRIVKANTEAGDGTPEGTPGVVLGSVVNDEGRIAYFVEWANRPRLAVGCAALKVKAVE